MNNTVTRIYWIYWSTTMIDYIKSKWAWLTRQFHHLKRFPEARRIRKGFKKYVEGTPTFLQMLKRADINPTNYDVELNDYNDTVFVFDKDNIDLCIVFEWAYVTHLLERNSTK